MVSLLSSSSRAFLFASASALALACTTGDAAAPESLAPPPSAETVTFHEHIRPILERVCQRCHLGGGIAPFSIATYVEARSVAYAMMLETESHRMPPFGPQTTPECAPSLPWKDDTRLTEQEVKLFATWYNAGAIEGNPGATAQGQSNNVVTARPTQSAPLPPALTNATTLSPRIPYTPSSPRDLVQCFLLDPKIEGPPASSAKYLNGAYFIPTNKTLVHHVLVFAIGPAGDPSSMVDGNKPIESIEPYECFSGPRTSGARLITGWAAGGMPMELPPNAGMPMPAGTRFVMQVHYHAHHGGLEPDATAFQYRLTDVKPEYIAEARLIGNYTSAPGLLPGPNDPPTGPAFFIPKETKAHTETMSMTLGAEDAGLKIFSVLGNMHFAGIDEKITLRKKGSAPPPVIRNPNAPPDPLGCLFQDPSWRFDWRHSYDFNAPVTAFPTVDAGDAIDVRCTYDSTKDNWRLTGAFAENGLGASPRDLVLGDKATDESCEAGVVFLRKSP